MSQNNTPQEIMDVLRSSLKPILCIDSRKDLDAFGSSYALWWFYKDLGIDLKLIWSQNDFGDFGKFIDPSIVEVGINPNEYDYSNYDLLICIDSASQKHVSRYGDFVLPVGLEVVNIDHHSSNELFGTKNYVQGNYMSACTVLYEIFKSTGVSISKDMYYHLAIGVLSDSSFFKFASVSGMDYEILAETMNAGVDMFSKFVWEFTSNESIDAAMLKKYVYNNLVLDLEKKYAYSYVTRDELRAGKINYLNLRLNPVQLYRGVEGMDFVFFIHPDLSRSDLYHVSFRSRMPDYDVSILAKKIGGGGHTQAAAGEIEAVDINDAISIVKKVIEG